MTPTQQAAYTAALIGEIGGDTNQVYTSYAFTDKHRRLANITTATSARQSWDDPPYLSLHWDSKLLEKLNDKYSLEERLTVAVGTQDEVKLLAVPKYQPGTDENTGEIIMRKTAELVKLWNCGKSIINM
ncbi:hypothetical protein SNE40_007402 [Patella caerulea]|uniref:Uncharacterized protein n=1 Tax=Patella caerulea TaxID=87958 RepID=A0AAN8K3I4_PATCE